MSINKFKNTWLSTDTSIPGGYSLRNEGSSLFSGEMDVSGTFKFLPTANYLNNNKENCDLRSAPYYFDYTMSGKTLWVAFADPSNNNYVFMPQYILSQSEMSFRVVNTSALYAVTISRYPASTTHRVYPSNIKTINYGSSDPTVTYILQPRQSCTIVSCSFNNSWNVIEGAKNGSENVWNKVSRFDASAGFGGQTPSYTVDVSGDINFTGNLLLNGASYVPSGNLVTANNRWSGTNDYYGSTHNVAYWVNDLSDSTVYGVMDNLSTMYNSAFSQVSGNTTLQTRDSGKIISINGSPITVTLPNASTQTKGIYYKIIGDATNSATLAAPTGQLMTPVGGLSSVTIPARTMVEVQLDYYGGVWLLRWSGSKSVDALLGTNNSWTAVNSFNGNVNLNGNNAVTGNTSITGNCTFTGTTNSFSFLPTSSATPTSSNQLVNKQYVDTTFAPGNVLSVLKSNVNNWTATQIFNNGVTVTDLNSVDKRLDAIVTKLDYDVAQNNLILGQNYGMVFLTTGGGTQDEIDVNAQVVNFGVNNPTTQQIVFRNGSITFANGYPTYSGSGSITTNNQFITRGYADGRYIQSLAGTAQLANTNAFTNTNTFSVHPSYAGVSAPSTSTQYTPKSYVDGAISTSSSGLLSGTNTWTGVQTFSANPVFNSGAIPTSAISGYGAGFLTASSSPTITGTYTFSTNPVFNSGAIPTSAISGYGTGFLTASSTPTITGTYTFSTNPVFNSGAIPTSAISGYGSGYVDTSSAQTVGGLKTFTTLPQSSATPSASSDLVTKSYTDASYVNVTGAQTINGAKLFGGKVEFQDYVTFDASMTIGTGSTIMDSQGIFQNSYRYKNLGSQYNNAFVTYTTSTTIPSTVSGRNINCDPTSTPITLTLPTIGTQTGYWYVISADNGDVTLARSGGDLFRPDSSTTSVIPSGYTALVFETSYNRWGVQLMQRLPAVDTSTAQTIAGTKTFSSIPKSNGTVSASTDLTTKGYTDASYVNLTSAQTVAGVKTFSSAPVMSGASISSGTIPVASVVGTAVNLSSAQTITGSKIFNTDPQVKRLIFDNTWYSTSIGTSSGIIPNGVAIGYGACINSNQSTAIDTVSIGVQSMTSAVTSWDDVAIGYQAMYNYTGGAGSNSNAAIGTYGLVNLVTGSGNGTLGAAAGSALQNNCNYNFALGQGSISNGMPSPTTSNMVTSANAFATSVTLASAGGVIPGQLCATIGSDSTPYQINVAQVNTSTNVVTFDTSGGFVTNSTLMFYPNGNQLSGTLTTGGTGTTFTIATGQAISAGYTFAYFNTATLLKKAVVSSYNSGTGQIILTTSITVISSSTWYTFDGNLNAVKGNNIASSCGFGKYSLGSVCSNTSFNTAFGTGSLTGGAAGGYDNIRYLSGNNNTALGANAGASLIGGSNCTFLGTGADCADVFTAPFINTSTAIGYGSKVSKSNQIVIGTVTETTSIPGALKLGDCAALYQESTILNQPTSATLGNSGSYYLFNGTSGAATYTLPSAPTSGTFYRIVTTSTINLLTINAAGTDTFSSNNNTTTSLRLYGGTNASVEIVYIGGVWYVLGGLFDCVRGTQPSFITNGTIFSFGPQTAPIMVPFDVSGSDITASTTLALPLKGTYRINAAAATTLTLPAINTAMIGQKITLRKTGNLATVVSIAAGTGNTIYIQNNVTTVAAGVATQIMSGTQAFGTFMCLTSTSWAIIS